MAKVTEVYMFVDGEQKRFSMKKFLIMRNINPSIRKLKFIPVDYRMY